MISHVAQKISPRLIGSSLVTLIGLPPQDPNRDDDENEDEDDEQGDNDEEEEPAVIREPDEC
jgi:hypothetical protein